MTARSSLRIARIAAIAIAALFLLAALPVLAGAGNAPITTDATILDTPATDDALISALLRAITEGQWWIALAVAGGLAIAVLRRQGLIRTPWLAAVASVALAVVGGVVHHWLAGVSMGLPMLTTAIQIAVPMVLALVVPPRTTEPPALTERS